MLFADPICMFDRSRDKEKDRYSPGPLEYPSYGEPMVLGDPLFALDARSCLLRIPKKIFKPTKLLKFSCMENKSNNRCELFFFSATHNFKLVIFCFLNYST